VIFHPAARDVIRRFPREVRDKLGRYLYELQLGESLSMPHSRPMPSVGAGVSELRVSGMDGTYRVFYVIRVYR
jgi:phage-related protein